MSVVVTLTGYTRLRNTGMGNPRYLLHTSHGDYLLSSNVMCAYEVTNYAIGDRLVLALTPAGNVKSIQKANT